MVGRIFSRISASLGSASGLHVGHFCLMIEGGGLVGVERHQGGRSGDRAGVRRRAA
jgi:hypothetical protein